MHASSARESAARSSNGWSDDGTPFEKEAETELTATLISVTYAIGMRERV